MSYQFQTDTVSRRQFEQLTETEAVILQNAARFQYLLEMMTERRTPNGMNVLEIVDKPIYVVADGMHDDYLQAIDTAMRLHPHGGSL